ncbi:hypothetical protein C8R46DRAFT_1216725 [Mycena filopes]|nr:hypothetical protein C8R46DRAFT_1216725 [Mycena filopes]
MAIQLHDAVGDVPPELIGASTTVSGSKLYLFGGSFPSDSPSPLSHMYALDLELWKWAIIPARADTGDPCLGNPDVPVIRAFGYDDDDFHYRARVAVQRCNPSRMSTGFRTAHE